MKKFLAVTIFLTLLPVVVFAQSATSDGKIVVPREKKCFC